LNRNRRKGDKIMENNEIGSKLKQLRENKLLSMAKLSKLLKLSKNSICALENGKHKPYWNTLEKYKKVFNSKKETFAILEIAKKFKKGEKI